MEPSTPKRLYHYTDQIGFLGIIEKKELWATKILYLNDSKEFRKAMDIARSICDIKMKADISQEVKETLVDIMKRISLIHSTNICVCSFSEKRDALSQWRGYSKGMAGYCIGFDFDKLKEIASDKSFILKKCIYDEKEQEIEIEKVIDYLVTKYFNVNNRHHEVDNNGNYELFTEFVKTANTMLCQVFSLVKDENFKEEVEWRLISSNYVPFESLFFRSGNSTIIPFAKIKFNGDLNKYLTEVIVGHTPNIELAISATKDFKHKQKLTCLLNASDIPYRSW